MQSKHSLYVCVHLVWSLMWALDSIRTMMWFLSPLKQGLSWVIWSNSVAQLRSWQARLLLRVLYCLCHYFCYQSITTISFRLSPLQPSWEVGVVSVMLEANFLSLISGRPEDLGTEDFWVWPINSWFQSVPLLFDVHVWPVESHYVVLIYLMWECWLYLKNNE